jgi:hypothetical protein
VARRAAVAEAVRVLAASPLGREGKAPPP